MYYLKTRKDIFLVKQTIRAFVRITFFIFFITLIFFFGSNTLQAELDLTGPILELGINHYNDGEYQDALGEFKKVLIIDPANQTAIEYIQLIVGSPQESQSTYLDTVPPSQQEKRNIVTGALDEFEQMLTGSRTSYVQMQPGVSRGQLESEDYVETRLVQSTEEERRPFKIISFDDTVRATQPRTKLELQIGRDVYIQSPNIKRFLVINPEVLQIKKIKSDEVLIISKKIGSTYFHIWDDEGRWSFVGQVSSFKPDRPTLSDLYRQAGEVKPFKIRSSNSYNYFADGRRIDDLDKESYSFYQSFGIDGETPYGDFDSRVQIDRLRGDNEVTYYSVGLEDGKIGPFKGFDLRVFDYYIDFGNMGLGGASLRGGKLYAEAFNNKINYTLFQGRENQGIFSPLAPGFTESKDSYLEGGHIGLGWPSNLYQTFSYFHGYGDARDPTYAKEVYDYTSEIKLGRTKLRADVGYDTDTYSYLLNSNYISDNLQLTGELRNIEDDFRGVTGRPLASGELGGLISARYNINPDAEVSSRLDVYRDRVFPNPEDEDKYNIDFDLSLRCAVSPTLDWRFDYSNIHNTGIVSPHKDESIGFSVYKTIDFIKKMTTFITARHSDSKNETAPTADYRNERLIFGLRFGLTDHINFFASQELNWLEDYTGGRSKPNTFETGINYNKQVLNTPFYLTSRIFYRDEENTESFRSFLSGEDSLEAQAELRYQPSEDFNAYVNVRMDNIWAENASTTKRMEGEIRLGSRWNFDTGFRWNPVGSIVGIVFKDLNSDGIYQVEEPTIKGIKVMATDDKYDITDSEGMYLIENIRAKNVLLRIDTNTLSMGFVLTGPSEREVEIEQGKIVNIDFGVISRSEIYGIVFHDVNGDGKFDTGDKGVEKVFLVLEDGRKTITNARGQYYFRGIGAGEHKVTLDINSLPINLIPKVSLFKDIKLFEGTTYIHHIPLKEVK